MQIEGRIQNGQREPVCVPSELQDTLESLKLQWDGPTGNEVGTRGLKDKMRRYLLKVTISARIWNDLVISI